MKRNVAGDRSSENSTIMAIERIRTPKASQIVADRMRALIVRGKWSEGDTLPPEGQLTEALGVSRPTLREAYRILEAEKFIRVTRGSRSGAQVRHPRVSVAARYTGYVLQSQGTTFSDLYASQMAIEPFVVGTLCRMHDNGPAAEALNDYCAYLDTLVEDKPSIEFTRGVAEFHGLLVKLTGNKTLTLIIQLLQDLMVDHKADVMRRSPISREERSRRLRGAIKSYRKLITLIHDKDEEAALSHWRQHLQNAHAVWAKPGEGERIVDAVTAYSIAGRTW